MLSREPLDIWAASEMVSRSILKIGAKMVFMPYLYPENTPF